MAAALVVVSAGGATAQDKPASALPLLTRIEGIRALSQDDGARGYPVRIRGTVTHFDEILRDTLFVHDGAFGQFVLSPPKPDSVGSWVDLKAGDLVEIEGRTVRGGFAPNVEPSECGSSDADSCRRDGASPIRRCSPAATTATTWRPSA